MAAIFIADVANAKNKNSDIVGVWHGSFDEWGGTSGKDTLTLTINDDMSGVIEFVIKRKSEQLVGSYTDSVSNSRGVYNVIGKEFIKNPNNYAFDDFSGTVSNGVFSGKNFQFKKLSTAEQQDERKRQLQFQQAEQEKKLQAQRKKTTIIIYIIAGIFGVIYLKLPKERQEIVRSLIFGIIGFCLSLITLGIFSGYKNWKNDR